MIVSARMHQKQLKLREDYAEQTSEATGIEIQSQNSGVNRQLSMEGIAVEYFTTSADNGKNEEKYEFNSYISDDNKQDACDSHAHMVHLLIFFRIRKISVYYVNSIGRH